MAVAINWTDKQKKAIEKSDCNLIVSAAAGSGKTAVLVERIIQKIINKNIDIDSLLITTFTEAAAAKMKEDIKAAISEKLESCAEAEMRHLSRQLILVSKADISTIHAFCLRVIRGNFHLLDDFDPDFRIGNESEIQLIKEQALDEVFKERYENNDDEFYELLDAYSTQRSDSGLKEIVLKVYDFVKSMPFYDKWIDNVLEDYKCLDEFENTKFFDFILKETSFAVKKHISRFRICNEICAINDELASYESAFLQDIGVLMSLSEAIKERNMSLIGEKLLSFSPTGARAKKGADEDAKKYISSARSKAKEELGEIYVKYFKDSIENIENLKKSADTVGAIFGLVRDFDKKFSQEKRKKALVDFNDIEHFCLEILSEVSPDGEICSSECAKGFKNKYEEILIDEYQDANEMQEMIFSLISRGDNVFMVGDLKQSIYRFRHTNPMIFKRKMNSSSDDEGKNQRVIMGENFRSRQEVINFVNFIFMQISSETVGEMTYDERERLNFAAGYPDADGENAGGAAEIILVKSEASDEEEKEKEEPDDELLAGLEAEAQAVCTRIKELMKSDFKVYDKKEGYRSLKLSDVVILMRSPSSSSGVFSQVLEENGIGCFADVGISYYETEEIGVVMNLLAVIDNPRQDIALLSLMRSPIFSFSDEELVYIRLNNGDEDVYESVLRYCDSGSDDEIKEKCIVFTEKLEKWRKWAVYMQANELIDALYNDTDYYAYVGAMSGGDLRRANLRLLRKRAEAFEKTSYKGLFNFINFIEKTSKKSMDSKGARMLGENQDVVRIMSIHKSKGLEFPVVFVVGLCKSFNLRDLSEPVLLHNEYGMGVDYIDCDLRYKYPLPIKNIIKTASKYEQLSEEMRLLYVALTRAREKLILVACPRNYKVSVQKWEAVASAAENVGLPVYSCVEAKNYCDWLMPAVMRSPAARNLVDARISALDIQADLEIRITNEVAYESAPEYDEESVVENDSVYKEICSILDSVPDKRGSMLPQKLSVTELKRVFETEIDGVGYIEDNTKLLKMPAFMEPDEGNYGALRGSATHYIMQNICLEKPVSEEEIERLADDLYKSGVFSEKQRKAIDACSIAAFFKSDIAKRMIYSKTVFRELPFEINIPAADIYLDYDGDEKILVQGIIDCCFEEEEKFVVVDYKTDRARNINDGLIEKYKIQLDIYARALEAKANGKTIEKYIYFFSEGKTIVV